MCNKENLRKAYDQFKAIPFPKTPMNNNSLQDIHFDLVLFDSKIAGAIDEIIGNKTVSEDEFLYDITLETKIKILIKDLDEQNIIIARSYLAYLEKLKQLINIIK